MFADLHLLRPLWLLALVPVVLFTVLLYLYRHQHSPWHNLIAPHLQQVLLGGQRLIRRQPMLIPLLCISWCVAVLALSGPSWQKLPQPAFALKKATVLVLDLSMSMRATDMAPDRLTQQRFTALDFTDELAEGELALLAFAGDAFVISPLTPDHNNIRLLIPDLKPEIMPVQGSNMLAALQQAGKLLQQAGYPRGDIVMFTDGFDSHSYNELHDVIANAPHRLSIVAFGSSDGAPVQQENGELLKNAQGGVVIPKVPLSQLAALARSTGGAFTTAGASGTDLSAILALEALSPLDQADNSKQIQGDQWHDSAIYLVWLLLPLVLLQKRYSALLSLFAILLLPLPTPAAEWRDLFQTKQQQAVEDYANQDFNNARNKFSDPLWRGNAAYRSGDYASAEQEFRQAANTQGSADAWHNLGNSLAQQQQYEEALNAYQQALAEKPDFKQAEQNAQLMQQLLQQQKQQQQQQSSSDKQQDNDQAEQNGSEQQQNESSDSSEQNNSDSQQQQQDGQSEQDQQQQQENEQQTQAQQQETEQSPSEAEQAEREAAVQEAWPNASEEEQQQLDNLLRKVQDDPALLLRNKMYLEYLKRQQQRLPKGVDEQW